MHILETTVWILGELQAFSVNHIFFFFSAQSKYFLCNHENKPIINLCIKTSDKWAGCLPMFPNSGWRADPAAPAAPGSAPVFILQPQTTSCQLRRGISYLRGQTLYFSSSISGSDGLLVSCFMWPDRFVMFPTMKSFLILDIWVGTRSVSASRWDSFLLEVKRAADGEPAVHRVHGVGFVCTDQVTPPGPHKGTNKSNYLDTFWIRHIK